MRQANLLMDIEGLANLQADTNANIALKDMFEAYDKAKSEDDIIFCHPHFWTFQASWGDVFKGIFEEDEENSGYEVALQRLPWIDPDNYNLLLNMAFTLQATPHKSRSLAEFDAEFPNENNGILCCTEMLSKFYVYDTTSWYELHCYYISRHNEWINWRKEYLILPNIEYSNFCIIDIVNDYLKKLEKREEDKNQDKTDNFVRDLVPKLRNDEDKIDYFSKDLVRKFRNDKDKLLELSKEVARRNGYTYDDKLSKSEKKRRKTQMSAVFKVKKNNEWQYLSLDTENGQFEVCNRKGEHIGVWNFSGIKTAEADESGGHDIKL